MEFDKELVKGSTGPIVLALLKERRMYGYEIVKVVNERTDGLFQWKEGTLYPCLHRLESDRLVRSKSRQAANGKMHKYYRLTPKGRAELAQRTGQWAEFAKGVNVLLMGKTA